MAESALADGSQFDLVSNGAEYGREEDQTVVHVKLTESSQRAIDEFARNKRKIHAKPAIHFGEAGGKIRVPVLGGTDKEYEFQISRLENGASSMEYVKYDRELQSDFRRVLARMGEVTTKLTVQPIAEESMESAIQSVIEGGEQARKQCAKEIDLKVSTNVRVKVPPQKLKRPLTSSSVLSNHRRIPSAPDSNPMVRHNTSPMKLLARGKSAADGAVAASVPPAESTLPAALSVPPAAVDLVPSASYSSTSQSSQGSAGQQMPFVLTPSSSSTSSQGSVWQQMPSVVTPSSSNTSLGSARQHVPSVVMPSSSNASQSSARQHVPSVVTPSSSNASQSSARQQVPSVLMPSSNNASQSSARQPRGKDNKKYELSDVIVHMLALRPLKKVEINKQLEADQYVDRIKSYNCRPPPNKKPSPSSMQSGPVMAVLKEVARMDYRTNMYTLLPSYHPRVRLDWPFYTDTQLLQVKRNLLPTATSSPPSSIASLSPCVSNVSSQGSPVTPSPTPASTPTPQAEDKPPAGDAETFSYQPPGKKQRIAHQQRPSSSVSSAASAVAAATPAIVTSGARNAGVILPSSSHPPKSSNSKKAALPSSDSLHVESRENFGVAENDADYTRVYGQIASDEQRQRYKADFVSEYDEYMQLYGKMAERMVIFRRLYTKLRAESTVQAGTYEITKLQIMHEYHRLQSDSKYVEDRQRCDYLHAKLGHIKSLVGEYDKQHVRSDIDS